MAFFMGPVGSTNRVRTGKTNTVGLSGKEITTPRTGSSEEGPIDRSAVGDPDILEAMIRYNRSSDETLSGSRLPASPKPDRPSPEDPYSLGQG